MGFSYVLNPFTLRNNLCCDFCGAFKDDGKTKYVRKIPCPYGWCQAWATCDNCRKKGEHKFSSTGFPDDPKKKNHELCKEFMKNES